MIKKQIEVLRKQLDETETSPSMVKLCLQDPMPTIEFRSPSQAHDIQVPKKDRAAEVKSYKEDIRSRAKAAVACGRSFIA